VSVVIPARDAAPTLRRTLDALVAQDLAEPFEVLLVDDGSRDDTVAIARAHQAPITILESERSSGPGAARNRGAGAARAPVLAFTDADCFPTPEWLSAGLRAIASGADIVQGAVAPDPTVPRTPFDRTVVVPTDVGFYPTANLLVRRECFERAGGFRDWLLDHEAASGRIRARPADRRRARATRTPIGEDTLFAWQARRGGARTAFAGDAVVHHAVVPGTLWDEILDRWHWTRDMPGVAQRVPELRAGYFYGRWFFSAKTAHFDLAAASVLAAALTRSPLPLAGALPYARWIATESRRWPPRDGLRHAIGSVVSDSATLTGLLLGTIEWRCPLF
jgi:hypothetical protein